MAHANLFRWRQAKCNRNCKTLQRDEDQICFCNRC